MTPTRFVFRGNALADYAVPTALILVALVIAIIQLPSTLQGAVRDSVKGVLSHNAIQTKRFGANPFVERLQIQLADGSFITVDDYPSSLTNSIETVGTDGTTENLANILRQLAEAARGNGDEETANQLAELSNNVLAHAAYQRQTNLYLGQFKDGQITNQVVGDYARNTLNFQTSCFIGTAGCVSVHEFMAALPNEQARLEGFGQLSPEQQQGRQGFGADVAKMMVLNAKAQEKPFLKNNPAVSQLVQRLVIDSSQIHAHFSSALGEIQRNPSLSPQHLEDRVRGYTGGHDASTATQQNGEQVCHTGGGTRLVNAQCPL
jgi:hypothetical protein